MACYFFTLQGCVDSVITPITDVLISLEIITLITSGVQVKFWLVLVAVYHICIAINSSNQSQSWVFQTHMREATVMMAKEGVATIRYINILHMVTQGHATDASQAVHFGNSQRANVSFHNRLCLSRHGQSPRGPDVGLSQLLEGIYLQQLPCV